MTETTGTLLPVTVRSALKNPKKIFGRYVLLEELGRGGMGKVYKAWQLDLRRFVAIKFLLGTGDTLQLKRFYREAQTAAQLSHPNITSIYEISIQDGKHFIAMEYIDGKTLDHVDPPMEEKAFRKIVFLVRDVARAVHHAHTKGVIHRDLKPANIMLTGKGKPYVTDFGLARKVDGDIKITGTGLIMGTPAYMSPEQAQGESDSLDGATDVWSLGATFYEIMAGRPPFQGAGAMETLAMVAHADAKPPSRLNSQIPPELDSICLKALEKSRKSRYGSALDFARDLDRYLRGEPVLARKGRGVSRGLRFVKKRYPFLIAGALLAGLGIFMFSREISDRSELKALEVQASRFHLEDNWSESLRVCQEIEARGGGGIRITRMKEEARHHLDDLDAGKKEIENRRKALPKLRLASQKLREARSLAGKEGAGVDLVRQRYQEAVSLLDGALHVDPENEEALFSMTEACNDLRDEKGLPFAETLVKANPEDPVAWHLLSKLLLWRYVRETGLVDETLIRETTYDRPGEEERILRTLEKAIQLGSSAFHIDTARGLKWFIDGDYQDAWKSFQKAYEENPGDRDLLLLRAICSRFANQIHGNLLPPEGPFVVEAYQVQPNDLLAMIPFVDLLIKSDPGRAIRILDQARSGKAFALNRLRFRALVALDRKTEVDKMWERVREESLHPWILYEYAETGSPEKMQAVLKLLDSSRIKYPRYQYFIDGKRILILARLNEYDPVDNLCRNLLEDRYFDRLAGRLHEESRLYGNLAAVRNRKKDYRKAVELAEKSIGLFPRPHSFMVLAASLQSLKEYQQSIDIAEKGLGLVNQDQMPGIHEKLETIIDVSRQWIEFNRNPSGD